MKKNIVRFLIIAGISLVCVSFGALLAQAARFGFAPAISSPYFQTNTSTRFANTVSPKLNNAYDLGEPGLAWRNIYASGTIIGVSSSSTLQQVTANGNVTTLPIQFAGGTSTALFTTSGIVASSTGAINLDSTAQPINIGAHNDSQDINIGTDGSRNITLGNSNAINFGSTSINGGTNGVIISGKSGDSSGDPGAQFLVTMSGGFNSNGINSSTNGASAHEYLGGGGNGLYSLAGSDGGSFDGTSGSGGNGTTSTLGGNGGSWQWNTGNPGSNLGGGTGTTGTYSFGVGSQSPFKGLFIDGNSNVGIDSITPQAKLDVRGAVSSTSLVVQTSPGVITPIIQIGSDATPSAGKWMDFSQTATNTTQTYTTVDGSAITSMIRQQYTINSGVGTTNGHFMAGNEIGVTVPSTNSKNFYDLEGLSSEIYYQGQGNLAQGVDLEANIFNAGTGTSAFMAGMASFATNLGTSTTTENEAYYGIAGLTAGHITNNYAYYADTGRGTPVNNYGLYINRQDTVAASTTYAIYSAGGNVNFQNANVTSTGSVYFTGLSGPTVTDDITCWDASGKLTHQALNCTVSSIRFKQHVNSLDSKILMEEVRKLRPVTYDYKNGGMGTMGTSHDEGFIAEEVAMIDPYLVAYEQVEDKATLNFIAHTYPGITLHRDGKTLIPKTVDYAKISMLLTGAVQDMDARITSLENREGILERIVHWIESKFKK